MQNFNIAMPKREPMKTAWAIVPADSTPDQHARVVGDCEQIIGLAFEVVRDSDKNVNAWTFGVVPPSSLPILEPDGTWNDPTVFGDKWTARANDLRELYGNNKIIVVRYDPACLLERLARAARGNP